MSSFLDGIIPSFVTQATQAISTVVDRLVPDNNAAQKLKDEITSKLNDAAIAAQQGQLAINAAEAKSSSTFVAGWRPFIGWAGGAGFAVQFVVIPLVGYVYALFGHEAPPPIHLDPLLTDILFGILGLNIGARTYEKKIGVAS